jgi:putative nucleotidyltransferase with HDIG domain
VEVPPSQQEETQLMAKYSIHQPMISEQTKIDKPMRPLTVLLVHQDHSFVTWFESEFGKIFTLKILSNPENALTLIKNGYRPHLIIGDVRYGKKSGLEFFTQVKYLSTEAIRVVFSKLVTAKEIDLFNEQTAVHRFVKLPRPATDIHYQLRLLIEQFIPLQRSTTSLQALLFPNRNTTPIRRGSDIDEKKNDDASKSSEGNSTDESKGPQRIIQPRPTISTAVEPPKLTPSARAVEAMEEMLGLAPQDEPSSEDSTPEYELAHSTELLPMPGDGTVTDAGDSTESSSSTVKIADAAADDFAQAGISTAPVNARADWSINTPAPLRALVRMLSGSLPEMYRFHINNHAHAVADISVAIAKVMALSEEQTENVRLAALLHDCGKAGMDERILSFTPDMLSMSDKLMYNSHVERGSAMLAAIEGMEYISKIVIQHHEHYDGSGFPEKLEGPQIVLEAMIIRIADEYHNRVYRLPNATQMTAPSKMRYISNVGIAIDYRQSQALAMFRNQKRRYAPRVLEAFMELANSGSNSLVRTGTMDTGNDPTLVDEIAQKYASGRATQIIH